MKNIFALSFLILIFTSSCSDDRFEEPKSNKELIIGEWYCHTVSNLFRVGTEEQIIDSTETRLKFTFTEDFYVYTDLLDTAEQFIQGFERDTARYNFSSDTLFFIKNALAEDTFMIRTLDETELEFVIDDYEDNIGGSFVRRQRFLRLSK